MLLLDTHVSFPIDHGGDTVSSPCHDDTVLTVCGHTGGFWGKNRAILGEKRRAEYFPPENQKDTVRHGRT